MNKKAAYVELRNGRQVLVLLPAKKAVCSRCDGTGKHTNPNVDGDGISVEDMQEEGFFESYINGAYDVTCEECKGERVILDIDYDALTTKMLARLVRAENTKHQDEQEAYYERRWGC